MQPRVFTLPCCFDLQALYGSTLVFDTLRVAFPDSEVYVCDNASLPEASSIILERARGIGARHQRLDCAVAHGAWIRDLVSNVDGPIVIVDPDVHFWRRLSFQAGEYVIAGRWLPSFRCEATRTLTLARLHPSLLVIPDAGRLRAALAGCPGPYAGFDPWAAVVAPLGGEWIFHDTAGVLSTVLDASLIHRFSPDELDAYEHLLCGSYLALAKEQLDLSDPNTAALVDAHRVAREGCLPPRGLWRLQDEHFRRRGVTVQMGSVQALGGPPTSAFDVTRALRTGVDR